uniref:TIR domain-containing protein n=1 Tax=Denticeps clupeoides TaxID=299321 RepID=A0AAY4BQ11_9TELE
NKHKCHFNIFNTSLMWSVLPLHGGVLESAVWFSRTMPKSEQEPQEGVLPFEEVPNTEIRGHDLWFLPAKSTHTGVYVCENGEELQNHVDLHVGTGPCPDVDAHSYAVLGTSHAIHCYQKHIFNVDPSAQVTWLKVRLTYCDSECFGIVIQSAQAHNNTCLLQLTFNPFLMTVFNVSDHCISFFSDDKSYDAYVSYPGDGQNVSKARTFALHVLPDVLEAHYGYRLFIRGRDAQLGEAVFDVVTKTLRKCRSLIIVLDESPMAKYTLADTDKSLKEDELIETQREVGFERSVGIYEALVCSGLRVIIVQIGKGGGEEVLPPSLRLFTRNHKVLLWKTDIHNNIQTNQCGRFWKELRYEMPTVIKRNTYA